MLGASRTRGLDAGYNEKVKIRKGDGHVLPDSFDCIDDVISELRSMEEYVGHGKFDGFQKILEKLEKSGILFRRKQEEDVAPDPELRFLYKEDVTELRMLIDEYGAKAGKAKFDEHLEKIGSDDRLVIKRMNQREISNDVFETVDSSTSHDPLQHDMSFSQSDVQSIEEGEVVESKSDVPNLNTDGSGFLTCSADLEGPPENDATLPMETNIVRDRYARGYGDMWSISEGSIASDDQPSTWNEAIVQPAEAVKKEEQVVDVKPNTYNVEASGDCLMSSSAVTKESQDVSKQQRKMAQIKFNYEVLKTFHRFYHECGNINTNDVEEMCDMFNQRAADLEDAQSTFNKADQQQFCLKLLTKLRSFEQKAAHNSGATFENPNLTMIFQKLVDKLQSDAQNYAQFLLPNYKFMSDLNLLKCIASDSNIDAAQYVLRARKLRLRNLFFVLFQGYGMLESLVELRVFESELGDLSAHINNSSHRIFKCGMFVNKEHTVHLFNIITQFYDISQASITLRKYGSTSAINYQLLKSTFGPPPTDQSGKIRIKEVVVESPGMTDFLRWFCPRNVVICCDSDSEAFICEPSLTSGIEMIEFRRINADRLMENCTTPVVVLSNSRWSKESIFRILTAHRLSGDKCSPRNIKYRCYENWTGSSTIKDWEELFESWSRAFEALHGKIGRDVTQRTVNDNNGDYIALTLH